MKRVLPVSLLTATLLAAYPNGSRIPAGNAGEPGTGTPCASCHSVTLNPTAGRVNVTLPSGNTFTPGITQRCSVTVTDTNTAWRKGFQLTAPGKFTAVGSTVVISSGTKQYVSQSATAATWSFDWTAPSDADTVTIYVAGIAASGTRQTNAYTTSVTLTRAAAAAKPVITSAGIVNAASFAEGLTPGSWITIFGTNLAPAGIARAWRAEEITNGVLPTTLEGTSVRINGKSAAIAYVSETQLNVQAPADSARGPVTVEVTTSAGTSNTSTANLLDASPGIFRFDANTYRYVAAVHTDGVLAAPAGLFGASLTARPSQPGETLLLFGTGFGATEPSVAPGTTFSGSAPLASGNNLQIRIGGIAAEVKFAGLSAPGLYQFNVVVPNLPDGEHEVEAGAWGTTVAARQYLAVKQ